MANDRVKLSLEVSGELNRTLERLADQMDTSKSEVLKKAIALIQVASDAKKKGQSVGVVDEADHLVTRIVGV